MDSQERKNRRFLDFKAEKEDWNLYVLKDGSRLKVKLVLVTVLQESEEENTSLGITSKVVVGVIPPFSLMGKPSDPYTDKELQSAVIDEDIEFTAERGEDWNRYILENGVILDIKNVLIRVSRTSKFDARGLPIYLVNTGAVPKLKIPEALKQISKQPSSAQKPLNSS